jgi:hypothetical protein
MYLVMVMLTLTLIVGCSTVKTTFITPSGGPVADQYYVLTSTAYPIRATFFYVAMTSVKDIDGSDIPSIEYLDMRKEVKLIRGDYKELSLVVYMDNPEGLTLDFHRIVDKKIGKYHEPIELRMGGPVAKSNKTRQFFFKLPYDEELTKADYTLIVEVDENEVFRIGPFTYNII